MKENQTHRERTRDHNMMLGTCIRAIKNCEAISNCPSVVPHAQHEAMRAAAIMQNIYDHMQNFYVDIDGITKAVKHVRSRQEPL